MKKIVCFFIVLVNLFVSGEVKKDGYSQYVNKSYIVMDALNYKVIEGNNINLIRSVASVSKIMTAIVAIEKGNLDREVTITKEDIDTYGSSLYLQEGDKLTLLDLLYGLMLRSGNDASRAIARVVGGSVENFVLMMNEKAVELEMNKSTFNNPSGLDVGEEGNLSTSYDLALLMSYALKNETFLKITGSKEYKSIRGNWSNKNKLLRSYKYTIAGKTGFTYKAKRTLVSAARKGETTFVAVTLDCGNDFNFHKFLYERNFDRYDSIKILNKGDNYIEEYIVTCKEDVYVTLRRDGKYSLIHNIRNDKGEVYLNDGENKEFIGECGVNINNKVVKKSLLERIKQFFSNKNK